MFTPIFTWFQHNGEAMALPLWSTIPFIGLLLTLGIMSFIAANFSHNPLAHFWESNTNKLFVALGWSVPVIALLAFLQYWQPLLHSAEDYFSFIVLLFALYAISGGVYLDGDLRATPQVNTTFLAIGAVLANLVGTTGASMLLIRPFLKTNRERRHNVHLPVFFIFVVSNLGGALLPIGDPPLFLGYLKGVPFFWTLNLIVPWLTAIGLLLIVFFIYDTIEYRKEDTESIRLNEAEYAPLKLKGGINFLWLAVVLLSVILITPTNLEAWGLATGPLKFLREYIMLAVAAASFVTAPLAGETRKLNNFTFGPIQEVAYLFVGIFITMIPALEVLQTQGAALGVTQPWQFFWASGMLSSVLDNAPTYLTFLSLAQGVATTNPTLYAIPPELSQLHVPAELLKAVSLGSVFMGANTYIGNGPNFMVKAIADEWGYKTPDFFSYILKFSLPILIPIFVLITLLFFR